ncbi:MAG: Arc family DNA-binding protein, partial [Caldimonas sp.]
QECQQWRHGTHTGSLPFNVPFVPICGHYAVDSSSQTLLIEFLRKTPALHGSMTRRIDKQRCATLKWFHYGSMEKTVLTLTLKNIPTHLHARLKESAEKNRRSLNSEILTRLERDVAAPKVDRGKLARALKAFTNQLPYVDHRIGDRYKRKGLK